MSYTDLPGIHSRWGDDSDISSICEVCGKPATKLYLSGKVFLGFSDKWKCKECADKQDNKEKTTTTE